MIKIKKFLRDIGLSAVLILVLGAVAGATYLTKIVEGDWLFIHFPSYEVEGYAYFVDCEERVLSFYRDVEAYKEGTVTISRRLINVKTNAKITLYDSRPITTTIGYSENERFIVEIPKNVPNGEYIYFPKLHYDINTIKSWSKELQGIRFKIVGECKDYE